MDDVFLEGATPDGPAVVGHLSVIVDTEGITFLGPGPGERRTVGWDRMSPLEFGPPAAMPGGMPVTSLMFELDGRPLRLLVPSKAVPTASPQPEALEGTAPRDDVVVADDTVAEAILADDTVAEVVLAHDPVAETVLVHDPVAETVLVHDPVAETILADDTVAEVVLTHDPVAEVVLTHDPVAGAPVVSEPAAVPTPVPAAESQAVVIVESPAPVAGVPPVFEQIVVATPVPVVEPPVPVAEESVSVAEESVSVAEESVPGDPFEAESPTEEPAPWAPDDDEWVPTPPRARQRRSQHLPRALRKPSPLRTERMVRIVLVGILGCLIPLAAFAWYFHLQPSGASAPRSTVSDAAIAARVGIQPSDLPGWASSAPTGNAFAAGATSHGAAGLSTAVRASAVMARCLHVPISAVEGAFGMGSSISQRTAELGSPVYADPSGNEGAVNSVVDVVKTPHVQQSNSAVFQDQALFATCYQPFVQAMLPYTTAGAAGAPVFATATVQPVSVPLPTGPESVQVAAFQIARIANEPGQTATVVTTAIAVFDGRVQTTLGTVSNFVFPIDTENQLVRDLEIRTIGASRL